MIVVFVTIFYWNILCRGKVWIWNSFIGTVEHLWNFFLYIYQHTQKRKIERRGKKKTVWYYNYYYSYLLKKICVHIALVKHAHGTEFTWRVLVAYVSLGSMSVQSEMKLFGEFDTVALKQHFGKKIMDLEDEKKTVQVR